MVNALQSRLKNIAGVRHGFFTREGGDSHGIYAALNCGQGSGDAADAVQENRRRVALNLGLSLDKLVTLHQVHSADVVTVHQPWQADAKPKADAMVTDRPGLALGILTADCVPILFADTTKKIIGAAHAGWKGALFGIGRATVNAMVKLGSDPKNIHAAIGPCICKGSYEVSLDFKTPFLEQSSDNARFFTPGTRAGHLMFDLPGYVLMTLKTAGVGDIDFLDRDTLPDEQRFFSYRRTTIRGEKDYGRQISAIVIE